MGMSAKDLLSKTSEYDLQYESQSPTSSPTPSLPAEDEQLSLWGALEDPYIQQHARQSAEDQMEQRIANLRLRSRRRSRQLWANSENDSRWTERRFARDEEDASGDNCDHFVESSFAGMARIQAPTPPPFTVTSVSEDEDSASDTSEEPPSPAVIEDRIRRDNLWESETDGEDEESLLPFGGLRRARPIDFAALNDMHERRSYTEAPIRAFQNRAPNRIEPSAPISEERGLIAPNARFFIAKNKRKIAINFHPAM